MWGGKKIYIYIIKTIVYCTSLYFTHIKQVEAEKSLHLKQEDSAEKLRSQTVLS